MSLLRPGGPNPADLSQRLQVACCTGGRGPPKQGRDGAPDWAPGGGGSSLAVAGCVVVFPATTFDPPGAAVLAAGGKPIFADMDAATFALSPDTLLAALTPATAAVVLVHVGGLITPHADELTNVCERRGITLVEDAAHAHGSTFQGRFAGSFSAAAAFSFYPTKV